MISAVLEGRDDIEIWGDGDQTRSFMFIDDCIEGTLRLMRSDVREPLNVGSDELVTINQLVDLVEGISGVRLKRRYNLDAPKGCGTQQRQHAHKGTPRMGAFDLAGPRSARNL